MGPLKRWSKGQSTHCARKRRKKSTINNAKFFAEKVLYWELISVSSFVLHIFCVFCFQLQHQMLLQNLFHAGKSCNFHFLQYSLITRKGSIPDDCCFSAGLTERHVHALRFTRHFRLFSMVICGRRESSRVKRVNFMLRWTQMKSF